jgi:hypothetical protein
MKICIAFQSPAEEGKGREGKGSRAGKALLTSFTEPVASKSNFSSKTQHQQLGKELHLLADESRGECVVFECVLLVFRQKLVVVVVVVVVSKSVEKLLGGR